MKRLERIGSAAFCTITISLVCHLLSMSYNTMLTHKCLNCDVTYPFKSWSTSLLRRCYEVSIVNLFASGSEGYALANQSSQVVDICIPNHYLMPKHEAFAYYCLLLNIKNLNVPHIICASEAYNANTCKCE